ncbi:hypothetical protein E2562_017819, partial [Oryza meyeriana var. granulata]
GRRRGRERHRGKKKRRCMMKARRNKLPTGFIDPSWVNKTYIVNNFIEVVDYLARTLTLNKSKFDTVLVPYCANFHWLLLVINMRTDHISVMDSRRKAQLKF